MDPAANPTGNPSLTNPGNGAPAAPKPETVPLAALEAERQKRQAAETRIAEIEAATKKAADDKAAEEGRWKDLHSAATIELEAAKGRLQQLEDAETARAATVAARNVTRVAALPEDGRALVPVGLSGDALASWLDTAEPRLAGGTARPAGTKARGGAAPEIPADCIAEAKRYGKDPAWWFEHVHSKRKQDLTRL